MTAVAHPCDDVSLGGAVEARKLGLIEPILVGPPARIRDVAARYGIDITDLPIVESAHSHDSAAKAVALVREAKAAALMKGSLHTDELMAAVVARDTGIRTERRISHCFVMDVPGHLDPLIITDAAVNIAPTLEDKIDIVQNAIDLAHAVGFPEVRVAILSAMETVNPKVLSTIEAAALCKMADRGQITGALLDGPLALDNAICPRRRRSSISSRRSPGGPICWWCRTSRRATCWPRACRSWRVPIRAGIVLGARVPIILTSRADSLMARLASCAIASMVAAARRRRRRLPDGSRLREPPRGAQQKLAVLR